MSKIVLIGIDLGPNLSITRSPAKILWLIAFRREGMEITAMQFLRAGMLIYPISLARVAGAALMVGGITLITKS